MRNLKISKKVTPRDSDGVKKYLEEISRIPLITPEEEVILAKKIKTGDEKSLEKLVESNLRFVVSVAKQYENNGLGLSDLINEGNLGLIKAAQRFDETRGFKFISYAVWWIRQSIIQALSEKSRTIRLPLNKVAIFKKISKIENEIFQIEGIQLSALNEKEISEMANISIKDVEDFILINTEKEISIDSPINDLSETTLGETIPCESPICIEKILERDSFKKEMERFMMVFLTEDEYNIVCARFGINTERQKTLEEISRYDGRTTEGIRQIFTRAIRKLKGSIRAGRFSWLKEYI